MDDGVIRVDKRLCKSDRGYGDFDVIRAPNCAMVIPLMGSGEVVLVEQFRHGSQSLTVEFPGGKCGVGEDVLDAAKRELYEETGFSSNDWTDLTVVSPNPAIQDNLLHVFLAQDCVPGVPNPDKDEDMNVLTVPFREVPSMLRDGAFSSAACHVAFLAYLLSQSAKKVL